MVAQPQQRATWRRYKFKITIKGQTRSVDVIAPGDAAAAIGSAVNYSAGEEMLVAPGMKCSPGKIKPVESQDFFGALAECVKTGSTVSEALRIALHEAESPTFRGVIGDIVVRHAEDTVADSFAAHVGRPFKPHHIEMLRASEHGTGVGEAFALIADELRRSGGLLSGAIKALIYPLTMAAASTALATAIFIALGSKLAEQFKGMGVEPGDFILGISNTAGWVKGNLWVALIPILIFVGFALYLRASWTTRAFQYRLVKVPFLGKIVLYLSASRAFRAFMMLDRCGTQKSLSLAVASRVAGNHVVADYFDSVNKLVHAKGNDEGADPAKKKGEIEACNFAQAFIREGYRLDKLGRKIAAKMQAAEVTGDISKLLMPICDSLDDESAKVTKRISGTLTFLGLIYSFSLIGIAAALAVFPNLYLVGETLSKIK